jgi:hypothetical protein
MAGFFSFLGDAKHLIVLSLLANKEFCVSDLAALMKKIDSQKTTFNPFGELKIQKRSRGKRQKAEVFEFLILLAVACRRHYFEFLMPVLITSKTGSISC